MLLLRVPKLRVCYGQELRVQGIQKEMFTVGLSRTKLQLAEFYAQRART
jgi:hypothetical protein